jgi:ATP-binding cassette, subfamily C (CFTR/MRP), member 4
MNPFFSLPEVYSVNVVFINAVTFMVFYFTGGQLTPSRVFSVFTYVQFLKLSLANFLPKALRLLSESFVSVQRIPEIGSSRDIKRENAFLESLQNEKLIFAMQDATFGWSLEAPVLNKINLQAEKGQLTCICGPVGSGKSSLLHAVLGDMELIDGKCGLGGKTMAYVSQSSWILSGSIKENILFGNPFDASRFAKVIEACSLERDFLLFPRGADTLLGDRGVTLSGGQRARVTLARAVYHDADIYLLDDP